MPLRHARLRGAIRRAFRAEPADALRHARGEGRAGQVRGQRMTEIEIPFPPQERKKVAERDGEGCLGFPKGSATGKDFGFSLQKILAASGAGFGSDRHVVPLGLGQTEGVRQEPEIFGRPLNLEETAPG